MQSERSANTKPQLVVKTTRRSEAAISLGDDWWWVSRQIPLFNLWWDGYVWHVNEKETPPVDQEEFFKIIGL